MNNDELVQVWLPCSARVSLPAGELAALSAARPVETAVPVEQVELVTPPVEVVAASTPKRRGRPRKTNTPAPTQEAVIPDEQTYPVAPAMPTIPAGPEPEPELEPENQEVTSEMIKAEALKLMTRSEDAVTQFSEILATHKAASLSTAPAEALPYIYHDLRAANNARP